MFYVVFCPQSGGFPDDLREGCGMVVFPRVEGDVGFGYFRDAVLGEFLHAVDGGEAFKHLREGLQTGEPGTRPFHAGAGGVFVGVADGLFIYGDMLPDGVGDVVGQLFVLPCFLLVFLYPGRAVGLDVGHDGFHSRAGFIEVHACQVAEGLPVREFAFQLVECEVFFPSRIFVGEGDGFAFRRFRLVEGGVPDECFQSGCFRFYDGGIRIEHGEVLAEGAVGVRREGSFAVFSVVFLFGHETGDAVKYLGNAFVLEVLFELPANVGHEGSEERVETAFRKRTDNVFLLGAVCLRVFLDSPSCCFLPDGDLISHFPAEGGENGRRIHEVLKFRRKGVSLFRGEFAVGADASGFQHAGVGGSEVEVGAHVDFVVVRQDSLDFREDGVEFPEGAGRAVMGDVHRCGNVPAVHGFIYAAHEGASLGFIGAGSKDKP